MDDELKQLEAELERLQPARPSRALVQRIEADLIAKPEPVRRTIDRMGWVFALALPAAAALALMLTLASRLRNREPAALPAVGASSEVAPVAVVANEAPLKPVAAEKVLVSADDEGLVTLDDGTQARRERLRFVDTITWRNPRTNASLTWSVPREEVRVIPVTFQ